MFNTNTLSFKGLGLVWLFWKEISTFILQGCNNLTKSESEVFNIVPKNIWSVFYSLKNPEKCISLHQIIEHVFKLIIIKMFLEHQISVFEWLGHVTKTNAVKRLIAINSIQNKSCWSHNICVYCVYLLCIYKYTRTCIYLRKINMLCLYIKYIYI